jgi:hypothetical protein
MYYWNHSETKNKLGSIEKNKKRKIERSNKEARVMKEKILKRKRKRHHKTS